MNSNSQPSSVKTTEGRPTPGPWHVQPDPQWAGKHPYHDHRFITCGNPDMTDDNWLHDPESYIIAAMRDCQNQEANARLIAAAPALLAACKAAFEILTCVAIPHNPAPCGACDCYSCEVARELRSAIALAQEGK